MHGTWTLARALASAGLPGADAYELHARFRRPVELPSEIVVERHAGPQPGQHVLQVDNAQGTETHVRIDVVERGLLPRH